MLKGQGVVVRLHFENTEDFEGLFKRKSLEVTRQIISGVEKAITNRKRTALLFEISFTEADNMFEISLPMKEWQPALQSCLDHLHHENLTNEQIDCWKLLELVKNMQE